MRARISCRGCGASEVVDTTPAPSGEARVVESEVLGHLCGGLTVEVLPERDPVAELAAAVAEVERDRPLPRCRHGRALRDHAGEPLEPTCGCRIARPAKDPT